MTLNLWKIGGQPTSYNPLPTGYTANNRIDLGINSYVITFRAKSASNAVLTVQDSTTYMWVNKDFNLTPSFQTFTTSFSVTSGSVGAYKLYLYDKNSVGNIIIDSITLVQKPLPKLTVNGVDGFLSGKWYNNYSASLTVNVINDSNITLIPTAINQFYRLKMYNINRNTTYSFSVNGTARYYVEQFNSSDVSLGFTTVNNSSAGSYTFNTVNDSSLSYLMIHIGCTSLSGIVPLTSSLPVLNLGPTPSPYSPKTGDQMVMPVSKKNIAPTDVSAWEQGSINGSGNLASTTRIRTINYYPILPNTTYSLSFNSTIYNVDYMLYNGTTLVTDSNWVTGGTSFTTGATVNQFRLIFSRVDAANILPSEIAAIQCQLEKGSVSTSFIPYAVDVNEVAQRYVPKKNMVNNNASVWEQGGLTATFGATFNANKQTSTQRIRYTQPVYVQPNTTYTVSLNPTYVTGIQQYSGTDTLLQDSGWLTGTMPYTFTTRSDTSILHFAVRNADNVSVVDTSILPSLNFQIEQNSTATPYEPYKLILPPRSKGLAFNGGSYIDIPYSSLLIPNTFSYVFDFATTWTGVENVIYSKEWNQNSCYNKVSLTGGSASKVRFTTTVNGTVSDLNGSKTINDGLKHHVVCKFDGLTASIYVDGVLDAQSSRTGSTTYSGLTLSSKIGRRSDGGTTNDFTGTLYNFYLLDGNGNSLLSYDFTNPQSIAGNTVIPNPQNLIPSFDNSGWSIHANAKVMGKDVLHLDANGGYQSSYIYIPVVSGNTYAITLQNNPTGSWVYKGQDPNYSVYAQVFGFNDDMSYRFTADSSYNGYVTVRIANPGVAGSFDFIKPQLYKISGTEGTINGNPVQLNKPSKRTLYAKR